MPAVPAYVITAVPMAMPVTVPAVLTVATAALLLLHVPPVVASLRAVVLPAHVLSVPVMGRSGLFHSTEVVPAP